MVSAARSFDQVIDYVAGLSYDGLPLPVEDAPRATVDFASVRKMMPNLYATADQGVKQMIPAGVLVRITAVETGLLDHSRSAPEDG